MSKKLIFSFILSLLLLSPVDSKDELLNVAVINLPSRTLELKHDNITVKTYSVGVGKIQFPTPTGDFRVTSKIRFPVWENPYKKSGQQTIKTGKTNPLGTRWIGFYAKNKGQYGIHGTNEPQSVGTVCSHGCIRMKTPENEYLFDKLSLDSPIIITYYVYKLSIKKNEIYVKKYSNIYNKKINPAENVSEQLNNLEIEYTVYGDKISKLKTLQTGQSIKIGIVEH